MKSYCIIYFEHRNDVTSIVKLCLENTSRRRLIVNFLCEMSFYEYAGTIYPFFQFFPLSLLHRVVTSVLVPKDIKWMSLVNVLMLTNVAQELQNALKQVTALILWYVHDFIDQSQKVKNYAVIHQRYNGGVSNFFRP